MIVPMRDRSNRLPEMGKLKCGDQTEIRSGPNAGKMRATSIDVWRITSGNRDALEKLRDVYGGKISATRSRKAIHPLELRTETDVLRVVLPPDPLGDTPIYEKFGGQGIERRCDGERCELTQMVKGPEGADFLTQTVDCICIPLINQANAQGQPVPARSVCQPTTRLSVMFADVQFGGVWTVLTHSEAALQEMPGMVELVRQTAGGGLALAELRITQRTARGGTKRYNVPVIHPAESLAGLVAGAGVLGAAATVDAPALGPGRPAPALTMSRQDALVARLRALREAAENTESPSWEAWQTFLREQDENSWPKVSEMDEAQLDELAGLLDRLEA